MKHTTNWICGVIFMISTTCLLPVEAPADEGMWLFNNPPQEAAQGEVRLRPDRRLARAPAASRRCASTAAARARSSRPTAW